MHEEDDASVIAAINRDMDAVARLAGEADTWKGHIERCIDILREAERIRADERLMEEIKRTIEEKAGELIRLRDRLA